MKSAGAAALALPAAYGVSASAAAAQSRPRFEGKYTPKICLEAGLGGPAAPGVSTDEAVAAAARRIRQLGVEHVLSGGGQIPWQESRLKEMMDRHKANGLTVANLMISGFPNAIYSRPE